MFRGIQVISIRSLVIIAAVSAALLGVVAWSRAQDAKPSDTTWSTYLGSPDSSHYIALTQINRSNVDKLEVAWSYDSGNERAYEFNPIVVGNVMYVIASIGHRCARRRHREADLDSSSE